MCLVLALLSAVGRVLTAIQDSASDGFITDLCKFYISWVFVLHSGDTPWRWTTPRPDNFLNFYAHADCGDQQASGKEASKQKNLDFSFWFYCCMHVVLVCLCNLQTSISRHIMSAHKDQMFLCPHCEHKYTKNSNL